MTTISSVRFKADTSQQFMLFPGNLSDKIADNHPVRLTNRIVNGLDIDDILSTYKSGRTSLYHSLATIKTLVYSHFNNTYSNRKIEHQFQENIHYMRFRARQRPISDQSTTFATKNCKVNSCSCIPGWFS